MEAALADLTEYAALVLEAIAVLVVFGGGLDAFVRLIGVVQNPTHGARKAVWRRFGTWLLLGLEFELAADIVRTVVSPEWRDLGELAKERAESDEVKQFAQRMIDDHGKANEQLEEIAKTKGVALPTEAGEEHSKVRAELADLKGEEFDQKYMAAMAEDHQKAVDLFQKQAEEGQDPELKSFAEQTLPTIKEHLTQAQSMVQQAQAQ